MPFKPYMISRIAALLGSLATALALNAAAAEWLYVATAPGSFAGTAQGGGQLHSVQLPGGAVTPIGPIRLSGQPIAVTGLAVRPIVGTLYGITSDASPNHPNSLVTIDPSTANATLVGPMGMAGSDISFDKHGTLFVWLRETSQIGTVSLTTGAARPTGATRAASEPGGVAVDDAGRIYVATSGATGSLDQIDSESGKARKGPTLQGAQYPAAINAISIASDGRIFALNSNRGVPAKAALVTIDPLTGVMKRVGSLPDDADALVLMETPWSAAEFFSSRSGITVILGVVALAVIAFVILRLGRRPRAAA